MASVLSIGCLVLAILTAIVAPQVGRNIANGIHCSITRLRRFPLPSSWLISGLAWLGCALTTVLLFWPIPSVHDEFAYVLTADTFLDGRLTNPAHPFAKHFESWHIIQAPSYQAKYPPAQGLALALGGWLWGEKLLGVWLSLAVAMLASSWACAAWLPPRWAILSTLLLACNVPLSFAWGNSYWGGAVAMLGGSLLVGSLGYMLKGLRAVKAGTGLKASTPVASSRSTVATAQERPPLVLSRPILNWQHALAFGSGLGILAASRPFEGALMALPLGLFALYVSCKAMRAEWIKYWLAAGVATAATLGPLLLYNQAVSGQAFRMPYQVWTAQQGAALNQMLTPAMALVQGNADMNSIEPEDWRAVELARWMEVRSAQRLAFVWDKLLQTYTFYLQSVLLIPLLALPWALHRHRELRVLLAVVALVTLGSCTHLSAGHPHYVAGLTSALMILAVAGLRHLQFNLPTFGRPLVGGVLLSWALAGIFAIGQEFSLQHHARAHAWAKRQSALVDQLTIASANSSTKAVVFVHYTTEHNVHQEWVYNAADIDLAPVVWANDLGDEANAQLVEYYRQLEIPCQYWLLTVERGSEHLQAYQPACGDTPGSPRTRAWQLTRSSDPTFPVLLPASDDQVH